MNRINTVTAKAEKRALRKTSLYPRKEIGALAGLPRKLRDETKQRAISGEKVSAAALLQPLPKIDDNVVAFRIKRRRGQKLTLEQAKNARRIREKIDAATIAALQGTSLGDEENLDALARMKKSMRDNLIERALAGEMISAVNVRGARLGHDVDDKLAQRDALIDTFETADFEVFNAAVLMFLKGRRLVNKKVEAEPEVVVRPLSDLEKHIEALRADRARIDEELSDASLELDQVAAQLSKAKVPFDPVSFETVQVTNQKDYADFVQTMLRDINTTFWLRDNGVDPCGRDLDDDGDDEANDDDLRTDSFDSSDPGHPSQAKRKPMPVEQLLTYETEAEDLNWLFKEDLK